MIDYQVALKEIRDKQGFELLDISENNSDEVYIKINPQDFNKISLALHKFLRASVATLFAVDERKEKKAFYVYCVFMSAKYRKWFFVWIEVPQDNPKFNSLAKEIYSASLFERQIYEMYGIEPHGNPDLRRLCLHDEVWPKGLFPLRKDFSGAGREVTKEEFQFNKVEGEGVFEIPVGPVHAGIIGPGHFRFSVAGEPIINLETRLGFTHRGIEKLFEGKKVFEAIKLSECVSGDATFSNSLAFCNAVEKIYKIKISERAQVLRAIFLELERMYNHVNDIGGMAIDVGFSFPAGFASLIKEAILQLNEKLTKSRYLKGVNSIGGVTVDFSRDDKEMLNKSLKLIKKDFNELKKILFSSISFMGRIDSTGALKKKTAKDLGVTGLAARACGIGLDLRKDFPSIYEKVNFNLIKQESGDCLARLNMRIFEFEESINLISQFLERIEQGKTFQDSFKTKCGHALGYVEAWRGPLTYWVKIGNDSTIERCKITDPSFCNWQGLSYCVLGDIVPDFPLCNKSFDLSYSGNDL